MLHRQPVEGRWFRQAQPTLPQFIEKLLNLFVKSPILNSLTFLYAELLGRHYGGGVLELVPSEIARLRVPLVTATDLQFTTVDKMIHSGVDWMTLRNYTDPIILREGAGLLDTEIEQIRTAHQKLMQRRLRVTTLSN